MEIRQLEAFDAIVASGSVSAAARVLGRSQSVVSRQVGDLEQELGFELFLRTRPNITLTEPGVVFYQDAARLIADLRQLQLRANSMRAGEPRPLRILAATDLARGLLPDFLLRVLSFAQASEPLLKIVVEEASYEIGINEIRNSGADFAFVNMPLDTDGLAVHWCAQAPCMLAMAPEHPLAAQQIVELAQLGNCDIITLLSRYRMRYHLINSLVNATAHYRRRHLEVASQRTALLMTRAGLGVSLLDPFSLYGVQGAGVQLRDISEEINYMVGVVSLKAAPPSQRSLQTIACLRDFVRSNISGFQDADPAGVARKRAPHGG